MSTTPMIEVSEWKEGATRPGSDRKPRHDCIEILAVPPNGQVPQRGDVIHIHMPGDADANDLGLVTFTVLERELLWSFRRDSEDSQVPLAWSKMWIHVRRVKDYTKPSGA